MSGQSFDLCIKETDGSKVPNEKNLCLFMSPINSFSISPIKKCVHFHMIKHFKQFNWNRIVSITLRFVFIFSFIQAQSRYENFCLVIISLCSNFGWKMADDKIYFRVMVSTNRTASALHLQNVRNNPLTISKQIMSAARFMYKISHRCSVSWRGGKEKFSNFI